jgi:pimeloyl-ACP methyl ester carboxylesterase
MSLSKSKTASSTQYYLWQNYRCAYEIHQPLNSPATGIPLLLIHPIGVGLSRQFWQRFCREWYDKNHQNPIYNPDLLGCGESDMPPLAHKPINWAKQLQYFLQTVVKKPVIIVVQGALLPVAIELVKLEKELIAGLVFSDPTSWPVITKNAPKWQQNLLWSIFTSPIGNAFFRYARTRKFLYSFSVEKLFAASENVDDEWLDMLEADAKNINGRYAVFAFLARFWQRDYSSDIAAIPYPTLLVMGQNSLGISKESKQESPDQRLAHYLNCVSQSQGIKITGKNVMPYESTQAFVEAVSPFIIKLTESNFENH